MAKTGAAPPRQPALGALPAVTAHLDRPDCPLLGKGAWLRGAGSLGQRAVSDLCSPAA